MKQQPHPRIERKRSAIIVIDMQNDFIADDGMFSRNGRDVKKKQEVALELGNFLENARKIDVPIIFVQSLYGEQYLNKALKIKFSETQIGNEFPLDSLCIEGTLGAEIFPGLVIETDVIINKHSHSAFINTGLSSVLLSLRRDQLLICGIESNACVESTTRDASAIGYLPYVVLDLVDGSHENLWKAFVENVSRYFGWIVNASEILDDWKLAPR